jgi:hypothetical protein
MSDAFSPKVGKDGGAAGGDVLYVRSGGSLTVEDGGALTGTRIQRRHIAIVMPSATALSTVVPGTAAINSDLPLTVKSVKLLLEANLAGHATSNAILSLNLLSALASATTAIASKTFTTSNAVTAYVPATITLTTSVAVAAGESLVAKYTFASSGQDVPVGTVTVEYVVDAT